MEYHEKRAELMRAIGHEIRREEVIRAMSRVPREEFVSDNWRYAAYEDKPLPIGHEQTISQPTIIGIMTDALELTGTDKVLEIGTGSGYQTAILAELAGHVVSVERIRELSDSARQVLSKLGYNNVELHIAEETLGWPEQAPYNAIMVTAGAPELPEELAGQLAEGGRMVIPVGPRHLQELCKYTRRGDNMEMESLGGCRFVALIGKNAWNN